MLNKLLIKTRSYRRFKQEPAPDLKTLEDLIELARLAPSASNLQPLSYVLVQEASKRAEVFSCLTWAGYLTDWAGPSETERPTAYIVLLSNPEINKNAGIDLGLAAQIILLGAQERGFGGCLVGSIDRPRLQKLLGLPSELEIGLVMALGVPDEEVRLTTVGSDQDTRYWRDNDDVHYVPKRPARDQIISKY